MANQSVPVFIDLSEAFDTLSHGTLLHKLESWHVIHAYATVSKQPEVQAVERTRQSSSCFHVQGNFLAKGNFGLFNENARKSNLQGNGKEILSQRRKFKGNLEILLIVHEKKLILRLIALKADFSSMRRGLRARGRFFL